MSVINQVLNQLEKRGAHTATEQTMVHAVPRTGRSFIKPVLAFGLILMIGIVAWQWVQARKPVLSSAAGPNTAAASIAPKEGDAPIAGETEKLKLQNKIVELVAPVSGVSAANLPASRLSFELGSLPQPSTSRSFDHALDGHHSRKLAKATAKLQPTKTAISTATTADQIAKGGVPMKHVSPAQQADAEFRKAAELMQQGRIADAMAGYEAALRLDAGHDAARQALVALLLESKRGADAERVLQDRLNSKPDHTGFTMMLARLQVERGAVAEATATLKKALPYANSQADYQAFLAALLQRDNHNDEAISHYQIALQLAPNNGIWLMGYGISLQAMQRNADAKEAYKKALDTQTLSPDLQAFVQQKIKGL